MAKKIFISFCVLFLVYILWPIPGSIKDFKQLPDAKRSNLSGDTVQVPNVVGWFTDFQREEATEFYKENFKNLNFALIPPLRINYPPEFAYISIKDQTASTYLEEFVYPLKSSLFVNGYEPSIENDIFHAKNRSFVGDHIFYNGNYFISKVTLRFYPTNLFIRIFIYIGIVLSVYGLWSFYKRVQKENFV